jgi:hypothetical protein
MKSAQSNNFLILTHTFQSFQKSKETTVFLFSALEENRCGKLVHQAAAESLRFKETKGTELTFIGKHY